KRRDPLRRRVEVRRPRIRPVVRDRVSLHAKELVADDELVADLELDRVLDPQEDAVARLEVLEPEAPLLEADDRLAAMAEALSGEGDQTARADDRFVGLGRVALRASRQAARDVEAETDEVGPRRPRRGDRRLDHRVGRLDLLVLLRRELLQVDL